MKNVVGIALSTAQKPHKRKRNKRHSVVDRNPDISNTRIEIGWHNGRMEGDQFSFVLFHSKYLFAILIWSVVFLSPIPLIPQHNAIKNPTY